MTDRGDPQVPEGTPLDELASAIVDGEATPAERARADEADVAARVASFEAVAGRLGAPVEPPSDATREALIGRALAAGHAPTSLDAHRRRRMPAWLPAVGGVAAAALALVGLAAFLGTTSGDDDDAAQGDAATEAPGASGTDEATSAPDDAGGGSERASASLGDFATTDELVEALRLSPTAFRDDDTAAEDGGETAESVAQAPQPCLEALGTPLVATYTATVDGTLVLIGVLHVPVASYRIVDASSCEEITAGNL